MKHPISDQNSEQIERQDEASFDVGSLDFNETTFGPHTLINTSSKMSGSSPSVHSSKTSTVTQQDEHGGKDATRGRYSILFSPPSASE